MREWTVDKDYVRIGIAAVGWLCLISMCLSVLTGCVRFEGDGFVNGRGPQNAVICKEISPSFIKCEDVKD